MYNDTGTNFLDKIPFGRTEDGNLIGESLNTEWEMNFQGSAAVLTLTLSVLYAAHCVFKQIYG
eukprot:2475397-Pleurochrysis_carterae.AAC.1